MKQKSWGLIVIVLLPCLLIACNRAISPSNPTSTGLNEKVDALNSKLDNLQAEVVKVAKQLRFATVSVEDSSSALTLDETDIHTVAEAQNAIDTLGTTATAIGLADALATIDTWITIPEEEKDFREFKLKCASQLRQKVKDEVVALQKTALDAKSGAEGARIHSEAGAVLSLYPMSDETAVVEEAKKLSGQQAELAARLEVLRRQRYNHWAAGRIKAAIDGYNNSKSYLSPIKENVLLMDSLVETLGEVDPALLEPVVLELYNYVVDLTKGDISETDKIDLATRMSDPSIKRKMLGDF